MKGGSLEGLLGSSKEKPSEPDDGDELADAMSDLGEALADKDWSAAATVFRRAQSLCGGYEDETDEG